MQHTEQSIECNVMVLCVLLKQQRQPLQKVSVPHLTQPHGQMTCIPHSLLSSSIITLMCELHVHDATAEMIQTENDIAACNIIINVQSILVRLFLRSFIQHEYSYVVHLLLHKYEYMYKVLLFENL